MFTNIDWLGHASFRIRGEKIVYIDPWQFDSEGAEPADIVLVTHDHRDHLSQSDIESISKESTTIVTTESCASQLDLSFEVVVVAAGDKIVIQGVPIEVVAAYNTNKFKDEGKPYHPKEAGGVGYIVTLGEKRIYHSGDTDPIPEIAGLDAHIVLLPVSGKAVMTAEEAATVVDDIRPELAIPMHYGSIMGSREDAVRFKELSAAPVEILEKGA